MHIPDSLGSMSTATSPPNLDYLVLVTLLKTSNPAVTRLLSVPSDSTFQELSKSIDVAFDWNLLNNIEGAFLNPVFNAVNDDTRLVDQHDELPVVLQLGCRPGKCIRIWANAKTTTLAQVLHDFRYSEKSFVYCNSDDAYPHAVQVVGKSVNLGKAYITCLGGQGYTTLDAWGSTRTGEIWAGGPSTWNLDLDRVCFRMCNLSQPRIHVSGSDM